MKRVTIKDLAKLLNLSASTVSRALSDHPDISDFTKEKVRTLAEELNYTTNVQARFFRKQHSGLIALVLPENNMFFTPSLIKGINESIDLTNYSLITFISNDSFVREGQIIKQCMGWAVEGILISLSNETFHLDHLKPLSQSKIKCVLFDKSLKTEKYPSVVIDSMNASYQAISFLISKGHRNILGVFGNSTLSISQERLNGYKKALKENNIPLKDENMIFVNEKNTLDYILPSILIQNKSITAIYTMSDELLSKSLYHINRQGLSIPEDISIISISDGVYPYLVYPQITHIKDSGSKMGERATRILLDSIAGRFKNENNPIIISTQLVELMSVKNIKF